jgi:penicillin-binding protein 1A
MLTTIPEVPRGTGTSPRLWRLRFGASIAWLSRHWTATQALTAVLERAHYGHRFRGLEAAALGYYGRKPAELTRVELASLVVTANRVVKFNPWCRRSENAEAVAQLLTRFEPVTGESADPFARLRPVPEGACPKP